MKNIKVISILICLCFVTALHAQNYRPTGEIIDEVALAKAPRKINISERSFANLPTKFSLEQYMPTPGDQGQFMTCVAWAVGYGVSTMLYAKTHGLTDKNLINKYASSPTFLYKQVKLATDNDCQGGANTMNAVLVLMKMGVATLKTVPYNCFGNITTEATNEALNYTISDASILFAKKGILKDDPLVRTPEQSIDNVKKALVEGSPVAISFLLPPSFSKINSPIWTVDEKEKVGEWEHGSHAMCVVGYDDAVAGGAFRVLNSWGTGWGDKGLIWIKYKDFTSFCKYAIQPFANPNSKVPDEVKVIPTPPPAPTPTPTPVPTPTPAPTPKPTPVVENTFTLSGNVEFMLNTGENMAINKTSTRNLTVEKDEPAAKEDLVAYSMADTYTSGTKFRFYINVDKQAYIYAFATDLTGKVNLILPFAENISTLVGSNTVIAFPSDTKIIKMDENKGRDYLLILYAASKLDAFAMVEKMNNMKGALSDKIKTVLGEKLIDKSQITYTSDKVGFSTKKLSTRNLTVEDDDKQPNTGTVVPLMVEIKHN